VRFLPEYDNVLLSHDDRGRFVSPGTRARLPGGTGWGSVLHDGFLCGRWRLDRDGDPGAATLAVRLASPVPRRAEAAIAAEARRLLRFLASDSGGGVRLVAGG
jgi:hypothetical protein